MISKEEEIALLRLNRKNLLPIPGDERHHTLPFDKDARLHAKGYAIYEIWQEFKRGKKLSDDRALSILEQAINAWALLVTRTGEIDASQQLQDAAKFISQYLTLYEPLATTGQIRTFSELISWYTQQLRQLFFEVDLPSVDLSFFCFFITRSKRVHIVFSSKMKLFITDPADLKLLHDSLQAYAHFSQNVNLPNSPTSKEYAAYQAQLAQWIDTAEEIVNKCTGGKYFWSELQFNLDRLRDTCIRQKDPIAWARKAGIQEIDIYSED